MKFLLILADLVPQVVSDMLCLVFGNIPFRCFSFAIKKKVHKTKRIQMNHSGKCPLAVCFLYQLNI